MKQKKRLESMLTGCYPFCPESSPSLLKPRTVRPGHLGTEGAVSHTHSTGLVAYFVTEHLGASDGAPSPDRISNHLKALIAGECSEAGASHCGDGASGLTLLETSLGAEELSMSWPTSSSARLRLSGVTRNLARLLSPQLFHGWQGQRLHRTADCGVWLSAHRHTSDKRTDTPQKDTKSP